MVSVVCGLRFGTQSEKQVEAGIGRRLLNDNGDASAGEVETRGSLLLSVFVQIFENRKVKDSMTQAEGEVPPEEEPHSRAMVVVAHPDDAEFGCSGSAAKWSRLGWDVVYVLCTDGSKGTEDRSLNGKELTEIRQHEQVEAAQILGLGGVDFLGFPDGYLEPTIELRRAIVRSIRKHRPHILITTNPKRDLNTSQYLGHPDHFAAGEAALSAVFPSARDHLWDPEMLEEGLDAWKVHEVWVMMFGEEADHWHPLEEEDVQTSIEALQAHASQIPNPDEVAKWMRHWRRENGKKIGVEYAEGFKKFDLVSPFSPDTDEGEEDWQREE